MKKTLALLIIFTFCISITRADYSNEFKEAYTRSYNNGITTQPTIDRANMNGEISRIELAKMISNYAIKILSKKGDTTKKCVFTDVISDLDKQYDNGVTNACQLGLMGQGIYKFRPYDKVTRAEFGTILSRLLYGNKYDGGNPYYRKHLNQLNIVGIMGNISNADTRKESRGNVMVMLKRSKEKGEFKIPTFDELGQKTSVLCNLEDPFIGTYQEYLTKENFILPYKDGYFGLRFGGQDYLSFEVTYRKIEDPCTEFISSYYIYERNPHDIEEGSPYKNNVIYRANADGEAVKDLNCKNGDHNGCYKEALKYFYNLIIGNETQEYFSLRIEKLKEMIDNNAKEFKEQGETWISDYRRNKYWDCYERKEVKNNNYAHKPVTEEEKTIQEQYSCRIKKVMKYCSYEYIGGCSKGNTCKEIEDEIKNCDNIKYTEQYQTSDEYPGYNVIYGSENEFQLIKGDKTAYINNKYGFKLKLGKLLSGGFVDPQSATIYNTISFEKIDPKGREEEGWGKDGYSTLFAITAYDKYNQINERETYVGKNNKYYFAVYIPEGEFASNCYNGLTFFDVK